MAPLWPKVPKPSTCNTLFAGSGSQSRDDAKPAFWGIIWAVAYSPDYCWIVVGFHDHTVGIWMAEGEQVATLKQDLGLVGQAFVRNMMVSSVAVSADRHYVFAGSVDMTAVIYEVESDKEVFFA